MTDDESHSLLDWLEKVDRDPDVLRRFFDDGVDAAVDEAVRKHGGHEHADLMKKNKLKEICDKLEDESEELRSGPGAGSVHQFWVLVRI